MNRQRLDELIQLVGSIIQPLGYECLEAEWDGRGALRLFIDRLDGATVIIDDCVAVTKALEDISEMDALTPANYHLEVSSPGIERPLRRLAHFERHLGETIKVKLTDPQNRMTGRLVSVSEDGMITLENHDGEARFPLSRLRKAHLVYDWDRPNTSV